MLDQNFAQKTLHRFLQVEQELVQCTDTSSEDYINLNREYKILHPLSMLIKSWYDVHDKLQKNQKLQDEVSHDGQANPDILALAREEAQELTHQLNQLESDIHALTRENTDTTGKHKGVILEIRAGTGGEEAALFAGVLYRMYVKYAQIQHWKTEVISSNSTDLGGIKEIIIEIQGVEAYNQLQYESGVHRVQRIPQTESSGRVHTSAATVAILPIVSEKDIHIDPSDLRIDVFRSSGPGGQSVNTTDSAVRITHLPTKITVSQQDEKSQHQNKQKAMKILRARLFELQQQQQNKELSETRKQQIGSGDRSERIRTYNFPQNRLSDHRIHYVSLNLQEIINGTALKDVICALQQHFQ